MHPKKRKVLLIILFLSFLFFGGNAVFYAYGWRIDLNNFKLVKVGGLYVKTKPPNAQIFLNGKLIRRGFSLFESGVLVNNLFPQKYFLEIKAKNFKDWKRQIEIIPSLVTEIKNATLIPNNYNDVLKTNIKSFLVLPNDDLVITDFQNKIIYKNFVLKGDQIIDVSSNYNKILTLDSKNKIHWLNYLENNTSTNLESLFKKKSEKFSLKNIYFNQDSSNELILYDDNQIYSFDLSRNNFNTITTSSLPIKNSTASKFWIIWSTYNRSKNISYFYIYSRLPLTLNNQLISFALDSENKFLKIKDNNLFILQNNGALYRYDLTRQQNFNIASDVLNFDLSGDGVMLAAKETTALEIFNLKDKTDYFRFHMPESKDILKIIWYKDNRHLFLVFKDVVKFMEIEDKFKENIQEVVKLNNPQNIFYNFKSNRFYFIDNEVLKYIEFPS